MVPFLLMKISFTANELLFTGSGAQELSYTEHELIYLF